MDKPAASIEGHFAGVRDPRIERGKLHKLLDILVIAICAVICGADTWVDVELFGRSKAAWLKGFLELPNGIPSHDTFGRVFSYSSWQSSPQRSCDSRFSAARPPTSLWNCLLIVFLLSNRFLH